MSCGKLHSNRLFTITYLSTPATSRSALMQTQWPSWHSQPNHYHVIIIIIGVIPLVRYMVSLGPVLPATETQPSRPGKSPDSIPFPVRNYLKNLNLLYFFLLRVRQSCTTGRERLWSRRALSVTRAPLIPRLTLPAAMVQRTPQNHRIAPIYLVVWGSRQVRHLNRSDHTDCANVRHVQTYPIF